MTDEVNELTHEDTKSDLPKLHATTYLGDGVYASFDGYQVKLNTHGGANQVIYLEPLVYQALEKWLAQYPRLLIHMKARQEELDRFNALLPLCAETLVMVNRHAGTLGAVQAVEKLVEAIQALARKKG